MKLSVLAILTSLLSYNSLAQYQNVIINQTLQNGTPIGELRKWEGSYWSNNFSPGSDFDFLINSSQVILGDQVVYNGEKYHVWNEDFSNVKNFHSFTITDETNELRSNFNPTNTGITIQTSLEGTELNTGVIEFRDPWFIDYPDLLYDGQLRNRGMDEIYGAVYKQRSSPFYPNATDEYEYGQKYNVYF